MQYFTLSGLSTDLGLLNNGMHFSTLVYIYMRLVDLIRNHLGIYVPSLSYLPRLWASLEVVHSRLDSLLVSTGESQAQSVH